jgi:hypothetical protein
MWVPLSERRSLHRTLLRSTSNHCLRSSPLSKLVGIPRVRLKRPLKVGYLKCRPTETGAVEGPGIGDLNDAAVDQCHHASHPLPGNASRWLHRIIFSSWRSAAAIALFDFQSGAALATVGAYWSKRQSRSRSSGSSYGHGLGTSKLLTTAQ